MVKFNKLNDSNFSFPYKNFPIPKVILFIICENSISLSFASLSSFTFSPSVIGSRVFLFFIFFDFYFIGSIGDKVKCFVYLYLSNILFMTTMSLNLKLDKYIFIVSVLSWEMNKGLGGS